MSKDNPISRAMVGKYAWNKFENYLPIISKAERGWIISVCLPDEYYQRWYPHIASSEGFRKRIVEVVTSVVLPHLVSKWQYLNIIWLRSGVYFQCEGSDCSIGVMDGRSEYSPHNVDSHIQATILFLALCAYLPKLYFVMKMLESGEMKVEDWPVDEDFFKFPHSSNVIRAIED